MARQFYVYILASHKRALYIGVTNDMSRRLAEHRSCALGGFTSKYNINRLVHLETTSDVRAAIRREKELKAWRREKKIRLIEEANPQWNDISLGF